MKNFLLLETRKWQLISPDALQWKKKAHTHMLIRPSTSKSEQTSNILDCHMNTAQIQLKLGWVLCIYIYIEKLYTFIPGHRKICLCFWTRNFSSWEDRFFNDGKNMCSIAAHRIFYLRALTMSMINNQEECIRIHKCTEYMKYQMIRLKGVFNSNCIISTDENNTIHEHSQFDLDLKTSTYI